ncbi:uncharacterized protein EDB93DRAFT_1251495 [Suillus bovinus]|uniref:uncharacterized protein n=1 Tax=Suillus bovinus TaxID=48563 RepID=UPI001B86A386|nr:uncharacterized protein EDB93DRAFT_1251495 [Suillus bovinus]KAG2145397.1 hypothetical protein EDB93DRAFT_1251495 [Suillus bovinus]
MTPFSTPAVNAMNIDHPADWKEPGEHYPTPRPSRGRGGCNHSPRQCEHDSDALSAFTCFFRAEAQAKELATRKEVHAFDQQIRAEHSCSFPPYYPPSRNLTVNYRRPQKDLCSRTEHPQWAPRTVGAPDRCPSTAAQVIADITSNAEAILAPAPTPIIATPDPGPDIDEIIVAAEQRAHPVLTLSHFCLDERTS